MINSFPLSMAPLGVACIVTAIKETGHIRKRLFDLGLLPDTKIIPLYRSPAKQPTAYYIRGATIAIRNDTADQIYVRMAEDSNNETTRSKL